MARVLDYLERLFIVLLYIPFAIALGRAWPTHPQVILVGISEMLVLLLILTRKPGAIAATPYAFLIAILGTCLPLFVRPAEGALASPLVTSIVMSGGLIINISAKLFLNRSFGIVAANRGVKMGGPYRLVRHPMYLGYFATQVGFLLANFNLANLALYGAAWVFQVLRIGEEEKLLAKDDAYSAYSQNVRWKLLPGVY